MVKGYEFAKDQYVDLHARGAQGARGEVARSRSRSSSSCRIDKVDPVYFDKTYYLGPDKGGDEGLRAARRRRCSETGRVALARYAARGKQYLVMLRPVDGGLVMQQLHYADEVRSFAEVPRRDARTCSAQELELAKQLIEQIAHRRVPARDVRGRRQEAHPGADPEEGRGRGDLARRAGGAARRRSSTSWRRSRRASRRSRRPRRLRRPLAKATASPKAVESARERKPARRAPRAAAERASAKR